MRYFTLTFFFAIAIYCAKAQESQPPKSCFMGGALSMSFNKDELPQFSFMGGNDTYEQTSNSYFISPYIGKELNAKTFIGLSFSYRHSLNKSDGAFLSPNNPVPVDSENKINTYGFGAFSRHILNPENNFQFFLRPSFDYQFSKGELVFDNSTVGEDKSNSFTLGFSPGVMYELNSCFRVLVRSGGLSYTSGRTEDIIANTETEFSDLSFNFNLSNILFGVEVRM